jgi:outer membrane protein OmpA-like peptidoglycan-associated protein
MSQGVNRLKELLFDAESQRLADVARRIEQIAERETARHNELTERQSAISERVEHVFDRTGTEEKLRKSVAEVIDGALRDAEVSKHEQLSQAVAPLVVRTIKFELKNSQDEMVDALYPITGKLVKQYVQAAVKDMMAEINRKLGGGAGKLSDLEARAKAQGITVAELVFAETQQLKVDELFLVKRGSGELVAHWERPDDKVPAKSSDSASGANRDVLIAGYLSGITAFSEEAFDDTKGSLRALDMDGERIFVRASPAYLLAARCSGSAPIAVEQIINDEFVRVLGEYRQALDAPRGAGAAAGADPAIVEALLPTLAGSFEQRFAAKRAEIEADALADAKDRKPSFARIYWMAAAILLPVFSYIGWTMYEAAQTARTRTAIERVLRSNTDLAGYPIQLDVESGGRRAAVSGLVPSLAVKDTITQRLSRDVAWSEISNNLTNLPTGDAASLAALRLELAAVAAAPIRRALERTESRIEDVRVALPALALRATSDTERSRLNEAQTELTTASTRVASLRRDATTMLSDPARTLPALTIIRQHLAAAEQRLAAFDTTQPSTARAVSSPPTELAIAAQEIAMMAERLSGLIPLVDQTLAIAPLQRQVTAMKERIDAIRIPEIKQTPRQALEAFTQSNAIFFGNASDLLDERTATVILQQIATLMAATDVQLRIVGYTDERVGPTVNNAAISLSRAERVANLLTERGVPRERLVVVGRPTGPDITRMTGPGSANRRVEFHVAFSGEPISR